ncbi:outer membrane protein [Paracoccaceae bacterium GXU_MW_L88]
MMKTSLLAAGFVVAGLGFAEAGKLEAPRADPIVTDPTPGFVEMPEQTAYDWNGFYSGGQVNASKGDDEVGVRNLDTDSLHTLDTLEKYGVNGGIHAGFRREFSVRERGWVLGLEAAHNFRSYEDDFDTGDVFASTEINENFIIRAKSGILSRDRATMYYTALGYVDADVNYVVEGEANNGPVAIDEEEIEFNGFSAGVGFEHKFNEKVSFVGQLEYVSLGSEYISAGNKETKVTPSYGTLSLGVNYQF